MCGSTVDIQSANAEIRRGKNQEEEGKKRDKNIMSASATQGGHNKQNLLSRSTNVQTAGSHRFSTQID